jgi:cardiolipin synthase
MLKKRQPAYTHFDNLTLVKGGHEYFDLLEELVNKAKHTIYFQIYIFDEDETGQRIAQALMNAAKRKVNVYLLVDGYASQALSKGFVLKLKEAGIRFRWFKPIVKSKKFFLGRRMHHKVIVTDTLHSLVGGLNISNRYNDINGNTPWLDWAVYATGEVAGELEKVCQRRIRDMSFRRSKKIIPQKSLHTASRSEFSIRVLVNDWVSRRSQITKCYIQMLRDAKSSVIIMSPYFLPGYRIRKEIKLATKRGVKIQLVLAGTADIPLVKYAERFMYDWLFRYNVTIYEYQKSVLHGKITACDGNRVTVGSYNVNNLSAYLSIELNLEIKNEPFARDVEQNLQKIIENDCEEVLESIYKRRANLWRRPLQWLSYNTFRFLFYIFTFRFKHKE